MYMSKLGGLVIELLGGEGSSNSLNFNSRRSVTNNTSTYRSEDSSVSITFTDNSIISGSATVNNNITINIR